MMFGDRAISLKYVYSFMYIHCIQNLQWSYCSETLIITGWYTHSETDFKCTFLCPDKAGPDRTACAEVMQSPHDAEHMTLPATAHEGTVQSLDRGITYRPNHRDFQTPKQAHCAHRERSETVLTRTYRPFVR